MAYIRLTAELIIPQGEEGNNNPYDKVMVIATYTGVHYDKNRFDDVLNSSIYLSSTVEDIKKALLPTQKEELKTVQKEKQL